MKLRYFLMPTLVLVCIFILQSCSSEPTSDFLNIEVDPHEKPASAEDSVKIEALYSTLNVCYNKVIADTAFLDSGHCELSGLNADQMFIFLLEDLGAIFNPDSQFNISEKQHIADIQPWFFSDDLKTRNYNQLFAEHVTKIERAKTILILESVLRMEPEIANEGFNSGLYIGYFHVLDPATGERRCAKVISAENSEYIYTMDDDPQKAIEGQLTADLNDQIFMALTDTFFNIYNLN